MRSDLVPFSASALVVGAMCLVLGSALNPASGGEDAAQAVAVVLEGSGRWLGMAVMYFLASVALTLGLPSILSVLPGRGRMTGIVGVAVFSLGVIGTAAYAMLLLFFRAVVVEGAIAPEQMEAVVGDRGLILFLFGWVGAFYLGVLVLALAFFRARTTPLWSTGLLVVFVAMLPLSLTFGRLAALAQVLVLAVAFTAVAIAAVNHSQEPAGTTVDSYF